MSDINNQNQESIKSNSYSSNGLWRSLLLNALPLGILMGIAEVCWIYCLPVILPEQTHSLPDESLFRFFVIAILFDIAFVLAGATAFGFFISILGKLHKSIFKFASSNGMIRFVLIAGILSYLYRGNLYIYFLLQGDARRMPFAVIGILVIMTSSLFFVLISEKLAKKFTLRTRITAWIVTALTLILISTFNYNNYKSGLAFADDMPTIKAENKPNILLITIDTLRADRLGCYGNKMVKTPTLDAIAEDGHLFENTFSQAPHTTPSHCSIMTSTYPSRHGACNGVAMKPGLATIANILQTNGYETAAFLAAATLRSDNSGLKTGFALYDDSLSPYFAILQLDEFQTLLTPYKLSYLLNLRTSQIDGNIITSRFLAWLSKNHLDEPFFCWLHYFDPHTPYDAPKPYKKMYDDKIDQTLPEPINRARYAGEITYTDSLIGSVINSLKEKHLYDKTMIIITSDHGEAFGETHNNGDITEYGHGKHLYDTTQHIPLIIKLPFERQKEHRIKDIVQSIDIAPTILDYLKTDSLESFQGKTFIDLIYGKKRDTHGTTFAETTYDPFFLNKNPEKSRKLQLKSIRTDKVKYIQSVMGKNKELYDLEADKNESNNIILQKNDIAQSYEQQLTDLFGKSSYPEKTGVDQRTLDQLKSLGYIGEEIENEN